MPANRDSIARHLGDGLKRLDDTRSRVEALRLAGQLRTRDVEGVYEALFLRAVTSFEAFLERLFTDIMLGRLDYPDAKAHRRVAFASPTVLADVLLDGGRHQYLDWLPYDRTVRRARIHLREGRPFTMVTDAQLGQLRRAYYTRNAIAHQGTFARERFRSQVIGNSPLLAHERTPAGYLRSRTGPAASPTRWEAMVGNLAGMAQSLCK
jgi:hypothetical protein